MSETYHLKQHDLTVEDFGLALYCGCVVYPWKEKILSIFTDCRCWGHTISVPCGSYVRIGSSPSQELEYLPDGAEYIIDDDGICIEVIQVLQKEPLKLECTRYLGVDAAKEVTPHTLADDFICHLTSDGIVIDRYIGDPETILIPAALHGYPVVKADLMSLSDECETILVSEGVQQLEITFKDIHWLSRLEVPESVELLSPPTNLCFTSWFQQQPVEQPIYLGRYYCGTPGHGCGGVTTLTLRDDTIGIIPWADFQCYWHRIFIPNSVTSIGAVAFCNSPCLEEVRLPSRLHDLGKHAFQNCPRLKILRLPDGLQEPVDSFQQCPGLREVSMPAACWEDHNYYFSGCPCILLRSEEHTEIIHRDVTPAPVTGSICAYSLDGPFTAADRDYAGIEAVVETRLDKHNYLDCYGNPVRFVAQHDPNFFTLRSGPYWIQYWYMRGPDGMTEIVQDDMVQLLLVKDGVLYEEIPRSIRRLVKDFFFPDIGKE